MDARTAQALIRFGLGRRGAEPLPPDPKAWLAAQLDGADPALARPGATAAEGLIALSEDRSERRAGGMPTRVRDLVRREWEAAIDALLAAEAPFRERLVWFWANHFTVSFRRPEAAAVIFPYLREAIRPHVTGRFADMLGAVLRHPAMLIYLDNAFSVGPGSPAGRRTGRGLNENLARECLELHTVTPEAGYTQADVTAFARVLTGWSIQVKGDDPGFVFRPRAHEPGEQTVLGRRLPAGEAGGLAAIELLGTHPATYRSLAGKLARHFIADRPPPGSVGRIAGALAESGGNLRAAALAVVKDPAAWQPLGKLRTPFDYVVAVVRALDPSPEGRPNLRGVMAGLGQPVLSAPLPNGWPDTAADWAGGEGLLRRVDWVWGLTGRAAAEPEAVADAALGDLLSEETAMAVRRAGSRREALTLALAGPEFQRR